MRQRAVPSACSRDYHEDGVKSKLFTSAIYRGIMRVSSSIKSGRERLIINFQGDFMRFLPIQLLVAIIVLPFYASASDNQCNSITALKRFDMTGCECGKSISKLPIAAPKGMSLIAACDYKKVEFVGMVGEFYFKGMATVAGEVRRETKPGSGDSVGFNANTHDEQSESRRVISSLKFEDDQNEILQFKFPPISEKSPCWAANAVIRVKLLYVQASESSDEEGHIPKDFEVLKVGQYRQCPKEEPEVATIR